MPYTMEEFIRQAEDWAVLRAPLEMRLQGIPLEEVERLPPEDREKFRKLF